jgi:LuxR family maltose regulon positive regulatory protein
VDEGTQLEVAPAQRRIIKRPRLTKLLDEAESRILLLVAPAGYGKTTLAREWLGLRGRRYGAMSGRTIPADLGSICKGLADALGHVVPGGGDELLERLRATATPEADVLALAELLAETTKPWEPSAWLLLDDYECIQHAPYAHEFFTRFVALSPANLLVAGRERPDWITSRDLLYGQAYELDGDHLSLTLVEARDVLNSHSRTLLQRIHSSSKGWPAVIGLAATAEPSVLQRSPRSPRLYEYLAEEVLGRFEPAEREALALLAVPIKIDLLAIESLVGPNSEGMLRAAERYGLLVRSPDGIEMHPLVREFLLSRTSEIQDGSPAKLRLLVERLIADQRWDDAYAIIDRLDFTDELSRLIEAELDDSLTEGRIVALAKHIQCARRDGLEGPIIDLAEAEVSLRSGDYSVALMLARSAAENCPTRRLKGQALYCAGSALHLMDEDAIALDSFKAAVGITDDPDEQLRALWGQYMATVTADPDAVELVLNDLRRKAGNRPLYRVRLRQAALGIALRRGNLDRAIREAEPALKLLQQVNDPFARSGFLNQFSAALVLNGRYRDALRIAQRELAEAQRFKLAFVLPHAYLTLANANVGLGNFATAEKLLTKAEISTAADDLHLQVNAATARLRCTISQGNVERGLLAPDPEPLGDVVGDTRDEYLAFRALGMACAARVDDAEQLLSALELSVSEARVPAAAAKTVLSLHDRARTFRSRAMHLIHEVENTENIDGFVCALRASPELLRRLAADEGTAEFVESVVIRLGDQRLANAIGVGPQAAARRAHGGNLSRREQEVLDLVARGLKNREIAKQLFISETTVKVHLVHTFEKLGVRNRMEAVARAEVLRQTTRAEASADGFDSRRWPPASSS